jgi:selenophosphate synthase
VLGKLARQHDPNVLVGFDHADDAGVYQLSPEQALVQTVDFFTPIVDDPFVFGQIAATNSLSDVYAMGGRPLTALALVCFPDKADLEILERILAGGLSKMIEAGCTVIGGHSIRDEETKFGYSVTGVIHPQRVLQNQGAKPGDKLILTKALGTGVISTAIKKGKAEQTWIEAATASMTTLNKKAADVITARVGSQEFLRPAEQSEASTLSKFEIGTAHVGTAASAVHSRQARHSAPASRNFERGDVNDGESGGGRAALQGRVDSGRDRASAPAPKAESREPKARFTVHAMTDITGFGLIGHAREILLASDVSMKIHASRIPILPGALDCIHAGHIPGGLNNNRAFAECLVEYDAGVPEDLRTILYDPQTAGGLFICTPDAESVTQALHEAGVPAVEIGEVLPPSKPRISIAK